MRYLTAEEVLAIHSEIIDRYGGSHGVRDLGLLESAVARPHAGFGDFEAYPTLWDKAAALARPIIRDHPFIDGNKRTGMTSAILMIERNGYLVTAPQSAFVHYALRIVDKKVDEGVLAEWFEKYTLTLE